LNILSIVNMNLNNLVQQQQQPTSLLFSSK
jgi:hypothetical protein